MVSAILVEIAKKRIVSVAVSLTTLDEELHRRIDPRTNTAAGSLRKIQELSEAGIPTVDMVAPVNPGLNDHEVPSILRAAAEVGAQSARYTIL